MTHAAPIDARLLASIDPDRRAGNGAQPPLPPGPSRRDGPPRRPLVAISWALVALMLVAIAVLSVFG